MGDFRLVVHSRGSHARLACAGELDIATVPELETALVTCVETSPSVLWLDLNEVSLLSSSGIDHILGGMALCRERGIALELSLSKSARRILDLVGLWWVGVIDDGLAIDEAMKAAREPEGVEDASPTSG